MIFILNALHSRVKNYLENKFNYHKSSCQTFQVKNIVKSNESDMIFKPRQEHGVWCGVQSRGFFVSKCRLGMSSCWNVPKFVRKRESIDEILMRRTMPFPCKREKSWFPPSWEWQKILSWMTLGYLVRSALIWSNALFFTTFVGNERLWFAFNNGLINDNFRDIFHGRQFIHRI